MQKCDHVMVLAGLQQPFVMQASITKGADPTSNRLYRTSFFETYIRFTVREDTKPGGEQSSQLLLKASDEGHIDEITLGRFSYRDSWTVNQH